MNEKQRTFGDDFGLDPVVPVGKHRDDIVECSDGTKCCILDAFEDIEGNYHSSEDDRLEREVEIVRDVLTKVDEWSCNYATENSDWTSAYDHVINECSHEWFGCVEEWIKDNCDRDSKYHRPIYDDDLICQLAEKICEELDGPWDCETEYSRNEWAAYSGDGCCLWGTDIGEQEEQIDVNGHDELKALHDADRLNDCLDELEYDFNISRRRKRVLNENTGHYEEVGRKTYMSTPYDKEHPTFEIYTHPDGRWDWIVPNERMHELLTEAILKLSR